MKGRGTTAWICYYTSYREIIARNGKRMRLLRWYPLVTVWADEQPLAGTRHAAIAAARGIYPWLADKNQEDRLKLLPFGKTAKPQWTSVRFRDYPKTSKSRRAVRLPA